MKFLAAGFLAGVSLLAQPIPERGSLLFDSLPHAQFRFTGLVGDRLQANVEHWLLRAPQANPGLLEMFRLRDLQPPPQLVPWAGEFVGKYLISAIQALRMSEDPRLSLEVSNVVAAFIATQAEDGYLGPFPQDLRLLKHWDLWGHYHAVAGLVLWHQQTGDPAALAAARKAADLVCRTYLGTGRRVFEAGDAEMNMTILTGLALLHRITGEPRYLQMARQVEQDWERAGDYLRAGLDGREFYQGPRPRWESLHDLQGLVELWRITGEPKYRESFIHHWRSLRRWDRRNTGGFSSGEQATGNPYAPSAIETCCTVAWIALTVDYLRLTGDPQAADDLELATLNAGLGAQHPSGRWWTYSTPMDGVREASAHAIVFQARAGAPELNCCSVNGPRALGLLSDWALMSASDGLVLNSYLPGAFSVAQAQTHLRLRLELDYPHTTRQRIVIVAGGDRPWTLRLRGPAWSRQTRVQANFPGAPAEVTSGSFLEIRRAWHTGDELGLQFDFALRAVAGANEAAGLVSLYRGPLLLACDQAHHPFANDKLPPVNLAQLEHARLVGGPDPSFPTPAPWLLLDLPSAPGTTLRLVDFASAGAAGTRYRSWLPALDPPPAPAFTQYPRDGERVRPGPVQLQWRPPAPGADLTCRLEIAADASFTRQRLHTNGLVGRRCSLDLSGLRHVPASQYWWRVVTVGPSGQTIPDVPPARFILTADAPPQILPPESRPGPDGELIVHSLRGDAPPQFGVMLSATFDSRGPEGTQLNGRDQLLRFAVPAWPEGDFSVALRVRMDHLPQGHLGQIFSAWAASVDDPLRLVVDQGRLYARIEAGSGAGTPGVPLQSGRWYRVAAVKRGATLSLFLDGLLVGSSAAPAFISTAAQDCALGGNPHYSGSECLAATFADFSLWQRALRPEELR